jgi:Domain of unknown function (DUF4167)
LINNRQGGRRRGRGGQGGGRNLGGQPGNRQDNRQRGNAAQLLEKYKNMARDAQLSGDRVQTEYFLQYADHYFRVLGESRARFEEQNPRRSREDDFDGDEGEDELGEGGEEQEAEASGDRRDRDERYSRRNRGRDQRPRDEQRSRDRDERSAGENDDYERPAHVNGNGGGETIPFDVLPPAIGRDDDGDEAEASEKPARRPRTRRARPADDDGEVAPAA